MFSVIVVVYLISVILLDPIHNKVIFKPLTLNAVKFLPAFDG
jgi:hypothetical protein